MEKKKTVQIGYVLNVVVMNRQAITEAADYSQTLVFLQIDLTQAAPGESSNADAVSKDTVKGSREMYKKSH